MRMYQYDKHLDFHALGREINFYQLVTLLEISVDQFFFPDKLNGESTCRKQIDVMLNSMDEKELTVMKYTAEGLQKARETEDA